MLNSIVPYVKELFSNKKIFIIFILTILFIGLAYYIYKYYITPTIKPDFVPNKEFVPSKERSEAELLFFYAPWCPHCKKALPIMEKIMNDYDGKLINNTKVIFRIINTDENTELADQYQVEGIPTIKLVKDGQVIDYEAKTEYDTMVEFLHTTL